MSTVNAQERSGHTSLRCGCRSSSQAQGFETATKRYDPITTVDITATILDIAHATAPHPADGLSRWGTLRTGDQGWTVPVVTEAISTVGGKKTEFGWFPRGDKRTSVGLRTPRYSFTVYRDGQGELYDLKADPAQMDNYYRDRSYGQVRADLSQMLRAYKDCEGAACRAPMMESFQTDPGTTRTLGVRYWSVIDKLYGR